MLSSDAVAVTVALLFPALLTWVYFVVLAQRGRGLQTAAFGLGKLLQFGFPLAWVSYQGSRVLPEAWPGLAGVPAGLTFGGLVLLVMLVAYYHWLKPQGLLQPAAEAIEAKLSGFGIHSVAQYVLLGVFYALIHSFLEEYYWRWFVCGQLRQLCSAGGAIALSALGFTLHHVIVLGVYFGRRGLTTPLFSLAVTIGGAFWAWLYLWSGSLVGPWLSHVLLDAAIFLVGYDLVRERLSPNP